MEKGFPQYRTNKFEDALIYNRDNGQRMEVAFIHRPGKEPVLRAATYNPNQLEPVSESPEFSVEEARYRYEFYKRLYESGQLGQQAS